MLLYFGHNKYYAKFFWYKPKKPQTKFFEEYYDSFVWICIYKLQLCKSIKFSNENNHEVSGKYMLEEENV